MKTKATLDLIRNSDSQSTQTSEPASNLNPNRSVACPRATGELAKGATWERLDRINANLPNPLTLMFIMEA